MQVPAENIVNERTQSSSQGMYAGVRILIGKEMPKAVLNPLEHPHFGGLDLAFV